MKGLVLDAKWEPKKGYRVSEFEKRTGKAVTGNSVWRSPKLGIREVAAPRPRAREVLVEVKACGVCGSDMHFYETDGEGYIMYPGLTKFPCILGHEFSGRVVETGGEVADFREGDMVTAEEMIWCGECAPCRNGFPNQCRNLEELGFTIDGAFAQYIAVGAKYCWKLNALERVCRSEGEIYEAGALVEPTCVAYNGMFERAGGFRPGGYVVVFGAGPIGLAAIALARAGGAARVIAFEVSASRRKLAGDMGADSVFDPREVDPAAAIMEETDGEGADMHVEAAGAPGKTVTAAERTLAINGRIVQIGRAAEKVPLYLENLQVRASQIFGAQGHSGNGTFPNVIRLMASGRIDMRKAITARFSLEEAVDGIKQSTTREDGKIMVKM
ncbi:MAG: scyllo-inosose 3-dehydrogenase [bacterium]